MSDWHFGRLDAASAVLANGRLTVRADGVKPGPCFDVMLSEYAPDPDSSADVQLGLYWRARLAGDDGAPAPYTVRAEVTLRGAHAAVVRIYHASGYVDLRVRQGPSGAPREVRVRPARD